ncbi:MAG: hypothetical protein ACK415_05760, partial [Thermodesulfovibrionales bacterium]
MIDEKFKVQDSRLSLFRLFIFAILIISFACTMIEPKKSGSETAVLESEKQQRHQSQISKPQINLSTQVQPEFVPVSEELSPLKTRIVSVSARATPLRDVLHVIAESVGLNLVMEKGVNPEIPITLTLRNINAEDALNTILTSVDYFYSIKDNMLIVKAMDTKIFELGQPS